MSDNERAERCETCRFLNRFEEDNDEEAGWCHRYPPHVRLHPLGTKLPRPDYLRHPIVLVGDWCGEWQPIGPDLRHVGTALGLQELRSAVCEAAVCEVERLREEIAELQQRVQQERDESHRRWLEANQLREELLEAKQLMAEAEQ